MKLVIVTAVEQYQKEVVKLFKKSGIENFSESGIEGYKTKGALMLTSSWFGSEKNSNNSVMVFSFTEDLNIDALFNLIKAFNENLESNNPIKAIVVPIEKYI